MIHSFPTRRSSDLLYSSVDDPDVLSAPRIPCDGQSRMMASRTVTSWASLNTQDSVPPLTSKPSKTTWLDCWNSMVCVPPRRNGRVHPPERVQRNVTGLPGAPRPHLRTMMPPFYGEIGKAHDQTHDTNAHSAL